MYVKFGSRLNSIDFEEFEAMEIHSTVNPKMACDSKLEKSSKLPEAKTVQCRSSTGTEILPFETEDDFGNRGVSSLPETRPAEHPSSGETKICISGAENDFLSATKDDLEFEIEKARLEIHNNFLNMKIQMDNKDKVIAKEMEIWTLGGLADMHGWKNPRNQFFVRSLINNFEEVIRNNGQESQRDLNHVMDDSRKIFVKLINRIEQSFKPRCDLDATTVTRRHKATSLWIGLLILVAVLIAVFPDYLLALIESAVAFYQSTILIFFLFCMLHCLKTNVNNIHVV